jgi:hypothetical protein
MSEVNREPEGRSVQAVSDAITSSLQSWNQGQQQAALDALRPLADEGQREALLLIAWFMSQMGQPSWNDGLAYARRAAEMGMPQALTYYFGQLFNDASYRAQTPDIARGIIAAGWSQDPLSNAPAAMQQNDPGTAVGLVRAAATPRPSEDALTAVIRQAEKDLGVLRSGAGDVAMQRERSMQVIADNEAAIREQRGEVEGRARSLLELIERITSAEATSYFEEEATTYGGEAKSLWRGGLAVLSLAALASLAPVLIYYIDRAIGHKPWIQAHDLVLAHTTAAVALAAVAGVLLARARGRDRARQRNRELSVALQTMFVYAEQIADESERQTFIRDMGRTVLDAFLRQEPAVDADRSVFGALRGH